MEQFVVGADMVGHEVTEDATGVPVADRAQIHLALTAARIREIGGPHGIGAALVERACHQVRREPRP
jgi:hypothetical protein